MVVALRWSGNVLAVLDQRALPGQERWIELDGAAAATQAIRSLAVRGAPLIGIVAAHAAALEVARDPSGHGPALEALAGCRPTAVNLRRAVERVAAAARRGGPAAARAAAEAIHAYEDAAAAALAIHGADLLAGRRRILTHCNTGALATGGEGSALGVVCQLARRGQVAVLACETRPLLQGARLTAWELDRRGIAYELIVDGAAAGLMARGEVDAVVVGCDRVAANGDVANKVGTYAHALAAAAADIPFVVAGPTSSIDAAVASGADIEIEERDADEVRRAGGTLLTLPGAPARNPAFDVTPAALVTALVTERGVVARPDAERVARLLAEPVPA